MRIIIFALLVPLYATAFAGSSSATPVKGAVAVAGSKAVLVTVFFNEAIADSTLAPQDFTLESKDGFEAASAVRARGDSIELMFAITPESYTLLQGLATSDSSEHAAGYSIRNNRSIRFINDSVLPGELAVFTAGQILGFSDLLWKDYVLDYYALDYMFPHVFKLDTQVPIKDSSQEIVLELDQSAPYAADAGIYWGLQSRWGTSAKDSFNFIKAYPLVAQKTWTWGNLAGYVSAETGPEGFRRYGRATAGATLNVVIPWAPLSFLRFGHNRFPEWPQLMVTGAAGLAWSDTAITDSKVKHPAEFSASLFYDFPVLNRYFVESNVRLVGSSEIGFSTRNYTYRLAFGYIEKGAFKILLSYEQGLGQVTYHYDKELLLGLALNLLGS